MMSNKNYTCSVSGNREIKGEIKIEKLKEIFLRLIKEVKINTFLIGMAIGFDTICFNVLQEIKKTEDIKIVACIPCLNQDYNFSKWQKEEYKKMLSLADEKIYIGKEYTKNCMFKRNRYLIENSSVLVCYNKKEKGGTVYTKNYAKKLGVPIIEI